MYFYKENQWKIFIPQNNKFFRLIKKKRNNFLIIFNTKYKKDSFLEKYEMNYNCLCSYFYLGTKYSKTRRYY